MSDTEGEPNLTPPDSRDSRVALFKATCLKERKKNTKEVVHNVILSNKPSLFVIKPLSGFVGYNESHRITDSGSIHSHSALHNYSNYLSQYTTLSVTSSSMQPEFTIISDSLNHELQR